MEYLMEQGFFVLSLAVAVIQIYGMRMKPGLTKKRTPILG
jgi:hypothetical protein